MTFRVVVMEIKEECNKCTAKVASLCNVGVHCTQADLHTPCKVTHEHNRIMCNISLHK